MARSLKKGPFVDPSLQRKVEKMARTGAKQAVRTWSRRSMITPDMLSMTFQVHNGKLFVPVYVTENMVGTSPRRVLPDPEVHRSLDGQEGEEGLRWKCEPN